MIETEIIVAIASLLASLMTALLSWYKLNRSTVNKSTKTDKPDEYDLERLLNTEPGTKVFEDDQITLPPKSATYLLWYLPRDLREDIIGDLEEEFQEIYDNFGYKRAIIWYWWQTIASITPILGRSIQKVLKWATVGWIADIIRRFIS